MINPADILFTRRCPFCGCVIELNKNECKNCACAFPKCGTRKIVGTTCAYAFPYSGVYKKTVLDYKFHGQRYMARALSSYIKSATEQGLPNTGFDYITYVPMFSETRFTFNPGKRLARELARQLNIPFKQLLIKTRKTPKQHSISYEQRLTNLKDAFSVVECLSGNSVLIVDDIVTTGSTLSECINTLKQGGAKTVYSAALCNSPLKQK